MKACSLRRLSRRAQVAAALAIPLALPASANAQNPSSAKRFRASRTRRTASDGVLAARQHPQLARPDVHRQQRPRVLWPLRLPGSLRGFRIIDIASSANPREVSFTSCNGNQGDVVVYQDILVRSWNSPAPAGATLRRATRADGFRGPAHLRHRRCPRSGACRQCRDQRASRGGRRRLWVAHGNRRARPRQQPPRDLQPVGRHLRRRLTSVHVFSIPLDEPGNPTTPTPVVLTPRRAATTPGSSLAT